MDFGQLNIDGLIDTGALSSAISEADIRKIRLLAPHTILNEDPPPEFQVMVANGQLEAPIATVELQFEVGDITFREKFIVMTNLTNPLIGLLFLQRNSTILDMRQGILNFPFFSMQLKNEDRTYPNVIEPIINRGRHHSTTRKTNHNLGKITDLHRKRSNRNNPTLATFGE